MARQRELQVSIKPAQADCIVAQLTALDCLFTFTFLSWQKTMQIYLLFVEEDCHCQGLCQLLPLPHFTAYNTRIEACYTNCRT